MTFDNQAHASNAIELTFDITQDVFFEQFSSLVRSAHGGQMGLYDLIGDMATVISQWELDHPDWWGDQSPMDWQEACEAFVDLAVRHIISLREIPGDGRLLELFIVATGANDNRRKAA